jgi:hypothetical protein
MVPCRCRVGVYEMMMRRYHWTLTEVLTHNQKNI